MSVDRQLEYPYEIIPFRWVYEISNDMCDIVNKYQAYKLTPYRNLTNEEIREMNELGERLYDYTIYSNDYNQLFTTLNNLQTFISGDFQDYVNSWLEVVNNLTETNIKKVDDKVDDFQDWWDIAKLSTTIATKTFSWDNWLVLPNVDYYEPKFEDNKIIETLMFKNLTFGTYTTILRESVITETIVITDPYDNSTIYNRTKTTTFGEDGSIRESVRDN